MPKETIHRETLEAVFKPFVMETELFRDRSNPNTNALLHTLVDAILKAGFRVTPNATAHRLSEWVVRGDGFPYGHIPPDSPELYADVREIASE